MAKQVRNTDIFESGLFSKTTENAKCKVQSRSVKRKTLEFSVLASGFWL